MTDDEIADMTKGFMRDSRKQLDVALEALRNMCGAVAATASRECRKDLQGIVAIAEFLHGEALMNKIELDHKTHQYEVGEPGWLDEWAERNEMEQ